ncbi:MAG: alcohol dehydrogenase catalytic domain-containing protein [Armatimonadota bacterium]|jgi:L-iditol 2-dehydrogenase
MRAVVVERCGEAVWREVPEPREPGPHEALVRTTAFSICNATDLHIRDCVLMGATEDNCPFLLGHEAVGEVIALGPGCRYLREGDRVLRPMLALEGFGSYWGGMAEFGFVSDRLAHEEDGSPPGPRVHVGHQVVPPGIPPAEAVVLITLKEVLSYLRSIGVRMGGRLLVTGHGPVGLAAIYLARNAIRAGGIVVAGRRPEAAGEVEDFGADAYVDTRRDGWPQAAMDALAGPADAVCETTGSREVTIGALAALAPDGVLGPYAARTSEQAAEPLPDDPRLGPGGTDESLSHDELVKATLDGRIDPARFISHRLAPAQIGRGFELIEAREALKVIFEL